MSKIAEIENKLLSINGDIFHRMCDHLLKYKFNPNSFNSTGSVIGKDKSKIGTPDTFFFGESGELIFSEYTTQEKLEKKQTFLNKLKSDIKHCFNEDITKIKAKDIHKVVLCHTSKLKVSELKELKDLCNSFNEDCKLYEYGINYVAQSVLDYPQLGEYIGVAPSTKQIQILSDFVESYEKSLLATPLSNEFIGRKDEIEKGLELLDKLNLVLVHGDAGTGKTKFCLELCKLFATNNNSEIRCINNKGKELWDDLQTEIVKDKNYILLVDDANRMSKNFEWTLNLLESNENIKIVSTVRSYAFSRIEELASKYEYEKLIIEKLSNDGIKDILKSKDFKISDPNVIDRIIALSKGNARIAIMAAKYYNQKGNNIFSLNDASTVYEEYFAPIFKDIELLSDETTLKILAYISFFGKIDSEDRKLCDDLFSKVDFTEEEFWAKCKLLHEAELVDMFENQLVKISDQILSTYLFYKAIIDKEVVKFSFFLDNYLSSYKYRFRDVVFSVVNTFNYKRIEEKISLQVLNKWHEIKSSNDFNCQIDYFDLFFIYLRREILLFAKDYIDSHQEDKNGEYRYTVEHNEFSSGTETFIKILSNFQYLDRNLFKDAFQLLVEYAIKVPQKMPALIHTIKGEFNFKKDSYTLGDDIQIEILDFLISQTSNTSQAVIFDSILEEVLPSYLKIEHQQIGGNGRAISIYTFSLWLRESVKVFRKKCFEYLDNLALRDKSKFISIISRLNIFEYKKAEDILEFDKNYLFELIRKHFNGKLFEDCYTLNQILKDFAKIGVSYPTEFDSIQNNDLFKLTITLRKSERAELENWESARKNYTNKLKEYCSGFDYQDYIHLLDNFVLILKKVQGSRDEYHYKEALNIILSNITEVKSDLFINVYRSCLSNYKFEINHHQLYFYFFKNQPNNYYKLFRVINQSSVYIKLNYYDTFNSEVASKKHLKSISKDAIKVLKNRESIKSQVFNFLRTKLLNKKPISSEKQNLFNLDIRFLDKFSKIRPISGLCNEILSVILHLTEKYDTKISLTTASFDMLLSIPNVDFEKIKKVYYYSDRIDRHTDYRKEILRKLMDIQPNTLVELLKFNQPQYGYSSHSFSNEDSELIWNFENYSDLMDSIIDYFITSKGWHIGETISALFPNQGSKYESRAFNYIERVITEKNENKDYIEIVFSVIAYRYPSIQIQQLENFIKINSDFEQFTDLELIKGSRSWSGSEIPLIESDKRVWQDILLLLDKMPNSLDFLKHKEYVEKRIYYCEENKKRVMKREFYEDY